MRVSTSTAGALSRVYVPNVKSGDVYVIDPATFQVVDHYQVGGNPQHIIPSWDLKTLWVAGSAERKLPADEDRTRLQPVGDGDGLFAHPAQHDVRLARFRLRI